MKRFYCTVCKKVKRVQNLPIVIENEIADNPVNRIGICNHHSSPKIPKVKVVKVDSFVALKTVSVARKGKR